MTANNGQFQILSLSGGGFRGLFTAQILADMEKKAGKPIGQCFDLVCGTSIGGIIALAIGMEKEMSEIVELMKKHGEKIFPERGLWRMVCSAKRSNRPLENLVGEIFGERTLKSSEHKLLVPAANYSTGTPQFFKTLHCEEFEDLGYKMRDVAMATSAAPVYFPVYKLDRALYVDGGIFGNNPSLLGIHEAAYYLKKRKENMRLLSIGTMGGACRADASKGVNFGIWQWRESLFDLTISMQEGVAGVIAKRELGDKHYYHIDKSPTGVQEKNIGLDVATPAAIETLTSMADQASREFLGSPQSDMFLGYSAPKFTSFHKQEGGSNGNKNT